MESVSLIAAFTAGIISFVSPCVLPLIPAYLSFISGISLDEMRQKEGGRAKVLKKVSLNAILFILGFSVVFIVLGATATVLGQFLLSKLAILTKIGGVILVILGLHIAGVFRLKFLDYEKRFHSSEKPLGVVGSFVVGVVFAFGWTPCIGPILAAILAYAGTKETVGQGIVLLSVYSLGLGLPFFLAGIGINTFFGLFERLMRVKKFFRIIQIVSGVLLILVGVLIFTNDLQRITSFFQF
jgi:cytochrome c-type biogenesis protein